MRASLLSEAIAVRSEEHTSELQSHDNLVCRLLLEKKKVTRPLFALQPGLAEPANPARTPPCPPPPGPRRRRSPRHHPALRLRGSRVFFNDTATTEIYTLSLHDALPI